MNPVSLGRKEGIIHLKCYFKYPFRYPDSIFCGEGLDGCVYALLQKCALFEKRGIFPDFWMFKGRMVVSAGYQWRSYSV